ncbi:hypothetical protein A3758_13035 [Oleiphilus sp. HI0118]|nr:hypothetical protein A3758_13035 [Oleiphilus sp. HI0118]
MAALGTTGYTLIDQSVLTRLSIHPELNEPTYIQSTLYMWCLSAASFTVLCLYSLTLKSERKNWRDVIDSKKRMTGATALIMTLTHTMVLIAMHGTENVSYLVALRQTSIVIGVILGVVLLKETFGRTKFAGLSLLMAGIWTMIPIT